MLLTYQIKQKSMTEAIRSNFQAHPFHLVSPSPWPFYTSISLLALTTSGALSMHSFSNAYNVFFVALFMLVSSMSFWFRDIISEGKRRIKRHFNLNIAKTISLEDINQALTNFDKSTIKDENSLSYYLAGLLEGDGHISIPALGNTTLNRVLNPRIVFTSHINNLKLYAFLQSHLENKGRFQLCGDKTLRYIIGDKEGIIMFIHLIHGKLRTPKNITFNNLIRFFNLKYSLNIMKSELDTSSFSNNSWLAGFTEADGHFGIKHIVSRPKSERRKRSMSENFSLKFRLDQRAFDKPTSSSMLPFMKELALFLHSNVKSYTSNKFGVEVLSLSVQSIENIENLIQYFDKYPVLGEKYTKYKSWKTAYEIIRSKEHLTEQGKAKLKKYLN